MIEKVESGSQAGIHFLRLKELPGVELYRGVRSTRPNPWHVHWVFALTVAERGAGIHRTREGAFPMTPGSIAVVNCGDAHSGLVPAGSDYSSRTIRIEPGFLSTCLSQITGDRQERLSVDQPVIHDRPLAQAILRLYAVLERPGTRLEKEYGLLEVLGALNTRHGRAMPRVTPERDDRMPIRRACAFLRDCYQENTSLAQLASLAGMTPFHFAKAFTRHVGVPPHAYQIQIRLRKATDLLAMGKAHVEVALETGFCDQSHFCRAFKRRFGITPGQYQR